MSSSLPWPALILLTSLTNISSAQDTCSQYTTYTSEPWRNVGFCSVSSYKSDIDLKEGWYRFTGIGGDELVSSCASAPSISTRNGKMVSYNLLTCKSNINYTDYKTCSEGFTVYYLRPTEGTYATRHSSCSSSSCGQHAQCGLVYGSCVCEPGFVLNDTSGCSVLPLATDCQTADCAGVFLDKLLSIIDEPLQPATAELYLSTIMNITTKIDAKNSTDNAASISYGNYVLAVTEKLVSMLVTPTETQKTSSITLSSLEAQVYIVGNKTTLSDVPLLNVSSSALSIDLIGISKENNGSAAVVFMSYTNLSNILKPGFFNTTANKIKTMMSSIVSATLHQANKTRLSKPVNFTFQHASDPAGNLSCVYWMDTEWAEDGCRMTESNRSYSVCSCKHLSTFALIMLTDPDKDGGDEDELMGLINTVAVVVGLGFLMLTILTLAVCHRGPKVTNAALLNLCSSLFLAHLFFLLTQQHLEHIRATQLCVVLAGVIYFLFLSAFVWMLIEAVLLYIFVTNLSKVSSMQTEVLSWKCMLVIGYAIPMTAVGVTSGLNPEGYSDKCWIKTTHVWSFLGPVTCIIVINLLLSCMIFLRLSQALSRLDRNVSHLKHTRTLVFKTLIQFVILGGPWALGFFKSNVIKNVFLFINSQQGTFIFIVHCLLNQEIRRQYRKWWVALCHCSNYKCMTEDQTKASHSHSK